jgi:hypothetical protein
VIFDQSFLPLALDTPVPDCRAAVLVLVRPGYFISPVPAISGELSPNRHPGGALWKTRNSSRSYEVMKWLPPGRRKRGRPKLNWAEGIRGLMGEKGLMEVDWNDRNNWGKKII